MMSYHIGSSTEMLSSPFKRLMDASLERYAFPSLPDVEIHPNQSSTSFGQAAGGH